MNRRYFLVAQSIWLAGMTASAMGQVTPRRIALLNPGTSDPKSPPWAAFVDSLKEAGYVEGRDVVFEERAAEGAMDRLPELAAELVAKSPTLIVVWSTPGVAAAKRATSSVPIVFVSVGNPVAHGFVANLRQPGGNITGVSGPAPGNEPGLDGKLLELMRDTLPASKRIAILFDEDHPNSARYLKRISPAVATLGLSASIVKSSVPEGLERAFATIAAEQLRAVFVPNLTSFLVHKDRVAALAVKHRAALFSVAPIADRAGALMSLTIDDIENHRRAGRVAARILKGEKPAVIPVEQPERFYLTVNLKTARELRITVPQSVLLRTDRVIE